MAAWRLLSLLFLQLVTLMRGSIGLEQHGHSVLYWFEIPLPEQPPTVLATAIGSGLEYQPQASAEQQPGLRVSSGRLRELSESGRPLALAATHVEIAVSPVVSTGRLSVAASQTRQQRQGAAYLHGRHNDQDGVMTEDLDDAGTSLAGTARESKAADGWQGSLGTASGVALRIALITGGSAESSRQAASSELDHDSASEVAVLHQTLEQLGCTVVLVARANATATTQAALAGAQCDVVFAMLPDASDHVRSSRS